MKILLRLILTLAIFSAGTARATVLPTPHAAEHRVADEIRRKLHPRPVTEGEDVHVQFKNQQEAIDWTKSVSNQLANEFSAKKFDVLPLTDSRYPVLQSYVHDIWRGFRELFPHETRNLNEPPVVLVDSEVVNAFVPEYYLQPDKIAHTVVVLTGLLDYTGGTRNADLLSGVFAHELTHSVFKHLLTEYQDNINKFYYSGSERLGFRAARTKGLDSTMSAWVLGAKYTGDLTMDELRELPSKSIGSPLFMETWVQFSTDLFDASKACNATEAAYEHWYGLQQQSSFEDRIFVNSRDLPALASTGRLLIDEEKRCLDGRRESFFDVFAKVTGVSADDLRNSSDFHEMGTEFDSAADPMEGLQRVVTPFRKKMIAVEREVPLSKLEQFTYEEHADDVSQIVLTYVGRDPLGLARLFEKITPEEDMAKCEVFDKKNLLPPPGAFSDPHRANCYRIIHLRDLHRLIRSRREGISRFASYYIKETVGD